MSDYRTFLNDPLVLARTWPGLKAAAFEWIATNRPQPWNTKACHAFLASFGLSVEILGNVWTIRNEMDHDLRQARFDVHEDGVSQAYSSAMDWLQQQLKTDEEMAQLYRERNPPARTLEYYRQWREKQRAERVFVP